MTVQLHDVGERRHRTTLAFFSLAGQFGFCIEMEMWLVVVLAVCTAQSAAFRFDEHEIERISAPLSGYHSFNPAPFVQRDGTLRMTTEEGESITPCRVPTGLYALALSQSWFAYLSAARNADVVTSCVRRDTWQVVTHDVQDEFGMVGFKLKKAQEDSIKRTEQWLGAKRTRWIRDVPLAFYGYASKWFYDPVLTRDINEIQDLVAWCGAENRVYLQLRNSNFWITQGRGLFSGMRLIATETPSTAFEFNPREPLIPKI